MTVKDESAVAHGDVETGFEVKVDEVDESTPPSPTKTTPKRHTHSHKKEHSHVDPPGERSERVLEARAVKLTSEEAPEETIVFGEQPSPPLQKKKSSRGPVSRKGSQLAVSDDPFAAREGKTLLWRDVNMTLVRRKT